MISSLINQAINGIINKCLKTPALLHIPELLFYFVLVFINPSNNDVLS